MADLAKVRVQASDETQSAWDSFKARGLAAYADVEGGVRRLGSAWERFISGAVAAWERMSANMGPAIGRGMEEAKTVLQSFAEFVKTKLEIVGIALILGVTTAFVTAIYAAYKAAEFGVGLLTGEAYKSANIDALIATNKEVKELQESLPLTAQGASALNEALKAQGVNAATYASTIGSVSVAARNNAEELDRLGVKYKDANGNILSTHDILENAEKVLKEYTAGWDRHQAAVAIGMGSEKDIHDALKITAERTQTAKDRLIEYGLIIGPVTQAAVERYQDSMRAFQREADLMGQGFKRAIADNVMPTLTDLADFFRDGFPGAVTAFRTALAVVTTAFYALRTTVYGVAETAVGSLGAITSVLGGLGAAAALAMKGDFLGAKDVLVAGWQDAQKRLAEIGKNIEAQARHNAAGVRQAWGVESAAANSVPNATPGGKPWTPKPRAGGPEEESPFQRMMNGLLEEELRLRSELTAVDKLALDIGKLKLSQFEKLTIAEQVELEYVARAIDLKKEEIRVNKMWVDSLEAEQRTREQLEKVLGDVNETYSQSRQDMEFDTKLLGMERDALNTFGLSQAEIVRKTLEFNVARETEVQLRKLNIYELQQEKQINTLLLDDFERAAALDRLYASTNEQRDALPDLIRRKLTAQSAIDQIRDANSEAKRFADDLNRSLTDALFRGFESGKSFGRNFFDTLKNMAKTTILQPIISFLLRPLTNTVGGTIASLLPGTVSAASGGGGGVGSALNLASTASSLSNLFGGSQAIADIGNFFGSIGSVTEAGTTFGAFDAISGFAAANPAVAAAVAAAMILGGKSLFGSKKSPAVGDGYRFTGAATIGGGFQGLMYDLAHNATQSFSDVTPQSGQVFYTDLINQKLTTTVDQLDRLARAMGLDTSVLQGRSFSINATGGPANDAGGLQAVENAVGQVADQIAEQLMPNLKDFAQANETLAQTFERLAGARRQSSFEQILNRMQGVLKASDDVQSLFLSDLSPLTAAQRLTRSQSEYARLLVGAESGDAQAISGLSGGARSYLGEARSYYASSPQYSSIFNDVQRSIGDLVGETLGSAGDSIEQLGIPLDSIETNTKDLDVRIAEALRPHIERMRDAIIQAQSDAAAVVAQSNVDAVREAAVVAESAAGARFIDRFPSSFGQDG